jgi:hypothetical protein
VEASQKEAAFSLATKAEVAVSVVELARKRKAEDRMAEEQLENSKREELAALSEQEVEELEVLLDGGQGERVWSVHARARRKRQRMRCSRRSVEALAEEMERWQPDVSSGGNPATASDASNGGYASYDRKKAMIATAITAALATSKQTAMSARQTITAMTSAMLAASLAMARTVDLKKPELDSSSMMTTLSAPLQKQTMTCLWMDWTTPEMIRVKLCGTLIHHFTGILNHRG